MANICFIGFTRRPHWHYDLTRSLEGISSSSKPSVKISDEEVLSFVDTGFVFRNKESRAGDTCTAQLSLKSEAFPDSAPVVLSGLRIEFEDNLKPIVIEHVSSEDKKEGVVSVTPLTLEETFDEETEDDLPTQLRGHCDLTLNPGQTCVLELTIPLREAGEVSALAVTLLHNTDTFDMEYAMQLGSREQVKGWFTAGSVKPAFTRSDAHVLQVHPRPPKMDIQVIEPLSQYYANEPIELRVQLNNAEDEKATIKLDVHLFGKTVPAFKLLHGDEDKSAEAAEDESRIMGFPLGSLSSSSSLNLTLCIDPTEAPTTYDLHLRATYHLESDAATPIMQMLPIQLNVVNAFEANYDLMPRLHLDPWPSLFDYEGVVTEEDKAKGPPRGLAQNWCLLCHYASFAEEDLRVVGMEMEVRSIAGAARCHVVKPPEVPEDGIIISPKTMQEARFDLVAQKLSLDDRHPIALDLAFIIRWQRQSSGSERPVNTTTMLAGEYLVLGSEPRVLASAYETEGDAGQAEGLMHLDLTIENPSHHFLTFGLTMEPSDEFAFSGSKQTTVHLLPLSRRTQTYRLLPLVTGEYVRPGLVVRDKYFQKVLRIIPTEGMKIDKEGLLVWVPPLDDDDDEDETKARSEAS